VLKVSLVGKIITSNKNNIKLQNKFQTCPAAAQIKKEKVKMLGIDLFPTTL
jgi:hypothetical protein